MIVACWCPNRMVVVVCSTTIVRQSVTICDLPRIIMRQSETIQVYSVTVMTHVKALQAGNSSQGTSEPITPAVLWYYVYGSTSKIRVREKRQGDWWIRMIRGRHEWFWRYVWKHNRTFKHNLHVNPAPNERNIVYLVSYLKIKCISDPNFFILLICDYSTFHTYQSRDYATFLWLVMSPQTGRGSNAKSAKIEAELWSTISTQVNNVWVPSLRAQIW